MDNLNSLASTSPLLSGQAVGAIAGLDLVCSRIGWTQVPRLLSGADSLPAVAHTGTVHVASTVDYAGGPQETETAIGDDYPQLERANGADITYHLREHKAGRLVLDAHERFSQIVGPLQQQAAGAVGRHLGLRAERKLAALMFTASNWGTSTLVALGAGGVQWSTQATARADSDIQAAIDVQTTRAGVRPTHMIMSQQVLNHYRLNAEARGGLIVTSGGVSVTGIMTDDFARAHIEQTFGLVVYIGSARSNSAAPNLTRSDAWIWDKSLWIGNLGGAMAPDAGSVVGLEPSAVLLLADVGLGSLVIDKSLLPISMSRTRQEPPRAKGAFIAGEAYYDMIRCDTTLGTVITAVIA